MLALAAYPGCRSSTSDIPARGSISLAWSITGTDHRPTECDQVGAVTVFVRLRTRAGDESVTSFPCAKSPNTVEVVAGPYEAAFELRAVDGTTLAGAPDQTAVTVAAGQTTTLAPVTFAMDAKASLALMLAAPPSGSNCKLPTAGGAGVTGNVITIERAGGGCAPVTFIRARAGTQVGTYQVDCGSPLATACVETDETLTVPAMDPGAYVVHVKGLIGGSACWFLDGVLDVRPGSRVARTLNLVHFAGTGC